MWRRQHASIACMYIGWPSSSSVFGPLHSSGRGRGRLFTPVPYHHPVESVSLLGGMRWGFAFLLIVEPTAGLFDTPVTTHHPAPTTHHPSPPPHLASLPAVVLPAETQSVPESVVNDLRAILYASSPPPHPVLPPPPPALPPPPQALDLIPIHDGQSCTPAKAMSTVAYAFITSGSPPLWPLWQEYFDGCQGTAVPLFHAQDSTTHALLRARSEAYNGYVLQPSEIVQGELSHDWKAVAAMLRMFRAASASRAPNGCTPRWVVTLPEHSAPVQSCGAVHVVLAASPGTNHIQAEPYDPYARSKWTGLWLPAAAALAAEEAALEAYWRPRIVDHGQAVLLPATEQTQGHDVQAHVAPDGVIIPFELRQRGNLIDGKGPTYTHSSAVGYGDAQPLCARARAGGFSFAASLGDGTADSSREVWSMRGSPAHSAPIAPVRFPSARFDWIVLDCTRLHSIALGCT